MANTKFTRAVKKAKGLYKTGRYKTFADAVKAAYKKVGKVGAAKKKKSYRQTGSSSISRDKQRRAKAPGKRKSASGKVYYERRKNRSDVPKTLTGVSMATLQSAMKGQLKETLGKQLLRRELATTKRDKRKVGKQILETKKKLRKIL